MRSVKIFGFAMLVFVGTLSMAVAGDFDWLKDLNVQAQTDPSGFKARLAARFKVGDAQITAVMSNMEQPADAYMIFRLGELSGQPIKTVQDRYRTGRSTGWGNLAKSLGVKPGSSEFHALKRGHDLDGPGGGGKGKGKGKKNR